MKAIEVGDEDPRKETKKKGPERNSAEEAR